MYASRDNHVMRFARCSSQVMVIQIRLMHMLLSWPVQHPPIEIVSLRLRVCHAFQSAFEAISPEPGCPRYIQLEDVEGFAITLNVTCGTINDCR